MRTGGSYGGCSVSGRLGPISPHPDGHRGVRVYSYYMGSHTPDDITRIVNGLRALVQLLRSGATEAGRRTGLSSAQLFVLEPDTRVS